MERRTRFIRNNEPCLSLQPIAASPFPIYPRPWVPKIGTVTLSRLVCTIGRIRHIDSTGLKTGQRDNTVVGHVFFTSSKPFIDAFEMKEVRGHDRIDLSGADFWDATAIGALDNVVLDFQRNGADVEVVGLNNASAAMVDRFAEHRNAQNINALMG